MKKPENDKSDQPKKAGCHKGGRYVFGRVERPVKSKDSKRQPTLANHSPLLPVSDKPLSQ